MDFRFITADKREALFNEVWSEPVVIVAKRYGMSDNGLRKHCKKLGIPLPPAGYWAKVKAGKKVSKPALPRVTGNLRSHVRGYFIKYKADPEKLADAELVAAEELSLLADDTIRAIREICSQLQVKGRLINPHSLIAEHKEETINRKKREKASKRASPSLIYYANSRSQYTENKPILPIRVSKSSINRTYRILDTIINTLEEMEGNTRVDLQEGKDEAYFIVIHSPFYFEVKEDARNRRLVLSMSGKRWVNSVEQLKCEYRDKDHEPLETQVGKIIYAMFVTANKNRALSELERRRQKKEWDEWDRKRRLEQMRKGELEEVRLLEQTASDWHKAELIRRFADGLQGKINELASEEKKEKLSRWLIWARDKADWLDPLTAKEDTLLGKSKHIFELIEHADY